MALTPMMQQYLQMKEKYSDCILFFRLGDFYEMFFEDAQTVSRELELTLTGKSCGLEERAPMCGVPFHSYKGYVERLVHKGYKVAICEQMEDPALAKGLVERDVIRIITAATLTDDTQQDERANRYLLSVCFAGDKCGMAFCDVSTGETGVDEITNPERRLKDEIARIDPREVITNDPVQLRACMGHENLNRSDMRGSSYSFHNAEDAICRHFHLHDLSPLGLPENFKEAVCALGAMLTYISETQKNAMEHITSVRVRRSEKEMMLDASTRRNLELTQSIRTGQKQGSLLSLLDKTYTAMGGRELRSWLDHPLMDKALIEARLDAIQELTENHMLAMTLGEELRYVYDMERLLSKVAYKSIGAKDCLSLSQSLSRVPLVQSLLSDAKSGNLAIIRDTLDPLTDLTSLLDSAIDPDCPAVIGEGGFIRDGYSELLDEYREATRHGKNWLADLEAKEREATGIKNLRIQYNRVFGYYIEVTKSNWSMVPERYIRRQTLANSERYTTPELREIETKVVGAQEQGIRLELQLFTEIREEIAARIARIQQTCQALKKLDAHLSLALLAVQNHYVRPVIREDGVLKITGGRHPVVETMMDDGLFVDNDTEMDTDENRMIIITGPNMAGKSTYMRQVALLVLMAHLGSFLPAASAEIPIVDRIFTRVGASDDLASGQSTFMVEMSETAAILRNATKNSLVILDEIGRGTSTFDGLAIAWAVVEYLCNEETGGAKTLFATHYHELSDLEGHLPGVKNYCSTVKEHGEDVIFLRKIKRGGADKSFGVHVARLAGIPHRVLVRAHEIQARLEVSNVNKDAITQNILDQGEKRESEQVNLFDFQRTEIINDLQSIDINALTPMDAMNKLFLLREKARKL